MCCFFLHNAHHKQNYNLSGLSFTSIEMHLMRVFPSPKKLQVLHLCFVHSEQIDLMDLCGQRENPGVTCSQPGKNLTTKTNFEFQLLGS